jgi:erythromycin esterase-like protein
VGTSPRAHRRRERLLITLSSLATARRRVAAALLVTVAACGGGEPPKPVAPVSPVEPTPVVPQGPPLPAGTFALSGLSPTLARGDLEPFRRIVGDALLVALGESTHTSRGYYEAKARLIRYLVEDLGFRAIAFETQWLTALPAARHVASCTGTPEAAAASLFAVWRDATVRDLLRWACEFNRAHPADPVTFFGFDVQEPWTSAPAVQQFVRSAAPRELARADALRRCLGAAAGSDQWFATQEYRDFAAGKRDEGAHAQCLAGVVDVESWIAANEAALTAATSAAAVEEARLSLLALRAWEQQLWVPDPGGYQARDQGMAEMLCRLQALRAPGKRTVVWAWNWHIARRYEEVRGFDDEPQKLVPRQGARAMGSYLHDALGARYVPIALVGYRVQTVPPAVTPPLQTNPLSVERRLHDLGREYLLVDLRQPLADTLIAPGRTYKVSQEWGDPYRQFDALLFLESSPAMTYLPISAVPTARSAAR